MCVQVDSSKVLELRYFSIGLPKSMKYGNDKEIVTGICKQSTDEAFLTKRWVSRGWNCGQTLLRGS